MVSSAAETMKLAEVALLLEEELLQLQPPLRLLLSLSIFPSRLLPLRPLQRSSLFL